MNTMQWKLDSVTNKSNKQAEIIKNQAARIAELEAALTDLSHLMYGAKPEGLDMDDLIATASQRIKKAMEAK